MMISREREKLLNAIIFFAEATRHCGKTKLFKLLYILDFEHFRLSGRSVTGLDYFAWEMGPVPVALDEELDLPDDDLLASVEIVAEQVIDHVRYAVKPKREFDASHFSKRELRIMEELAAKYRDVYAQAMVDVTHAENGAWEKVFEKGLGYNRPIPYQLAVSGPDSAIVLEMASEYEALRKHYGT